MFSTPLVVVGAVASFVKKYGIVGFLRKKKPRHLAAKGEPSTMQLVAHLQRQRSNFALAA